MFFGIISIVNCADIGRSNRTVDKLYNDDDFIEYIIIQDEIKEFMVSGKFNLMKEDFDSSCKNLLRTLSFCDLLERIDALNTNQLSEEYIRLNCRRSQKMEQVKVKYSDFMSLDSKEISKVIQNIKSTSDKYLTAEKVLLNRITQK